MLVQLIYPLRYVLIVFCTADLHLGVKKTEYKKKTMYHTGAQNAHTVTFIK